MYIPLIPHLIMFSANTKMAQKMQYKVEYKHTLGVTCDIFDGTTYCNLHTKYVETDGKKYNYQQPGHLLSLTTTYHPKSAFTLKIFFHLVLSLAQ